MAPVVFDDEGQPEPLQAVRDLAGIPVLDVDGKDAGEVFGALADADTGLVRYLDMAVARSQRHVLVPVGHTRLDEAATGTRAQLRAVTREELLEIPAFEADYEQLSDEYHQAVLAAFGRFLYGERYYAHPAFDHSGLYAGEHPITRGPEAQPPPQTDATPLHPLSALRGYRVVPAEPDVRGWPLVTRGGKTAARVEDLLVDTDALTVRYLVVSLEGEEAPRLVPVGFLQIARDETQVVAPALTAEDLPRLPGYVPGTITREEERRVREVLDEILSGPRRFDRPEFRRLPVLR